MIRRKGKKDLGLQNTTVRLHRYICIYDLAIKMRRVVYTRYLQVKTNPEVFYNSRLNYGLSMHVSLEKKDLHILLGSTLNRSFDLS